MSVNPVGMKEEMNTPSSHNNKDRRNTQVVLNELKEIIDSSENMATEVRTICPADDFQMIIRASDSLAK